MKNPDISVLSVSKVIKRQRVTCKNKRAKPLTPTVDSYTQCHTVDLHTSLDLHNAHAVVSHTALDSHTFLESQSALDSDSYTFIFVYTVLDSHSDLDKQKLAQTHTALNS